MNWYRFVYRACYALGWTPWDQNITAIGLRDLVEGSERLRPGRALDIGCGTGTNSVYLAKQGWRVTGVDMVPKAIAKAKQKAAGANVTVDFELGDATRLQALGQRDFDLLVDVGCFHTLPTEARIEYVRSVSAIACQGATLFLFGFSPRKAAPMAVGITDQEIHARFAGWKVVSGGPLTEDEMNRQMGGRLGRAIRYFAPWQYRLEKTPGSERQT